MYADALNMYTKVHFIDFLPAHSRCRHQHRQGLRSALAQRAHRGLTQPADLQGTHHRRLGNQRHRTALCLADRCRNEVSRDHAGCPIPQAPRLVGQRRSTGQQRVWPLARRQVQGARLSACTKPGLSLAWIGTIRIFNIVVLPALGNIRRHALPLFVACLMVAWPLALESTRRDWLDYQSTDCP